MDAFISGAWRTAKRGEVLIGGAWRQITRGEVYRGGSWAKCLTFAGPLSVSAYNVTGRTSNRKPANVTSTDSVATPTGGFAPYTYAWASPDGVTPLSPSMARTAFRAPVAPGDTNYYTARVTCTDALGTVATADITITLVNDGEF